MTNILLILTQFVFRLTFGAALAMGVTPPRLVTSGFYRVHLWMLLGMNVFTALAVYSSREEYTGRAVSWQVVFGLAIAAALVSYVGSVCWLYEQPRLGGVAIYVVALLALLAAIFSTFATIPATTYSEMTDVGVALVFLDLISSGLLLGVTLAAMLLGHWYLNTPTMKLLPLKRLVGLMAAAILVRSVLCAVGLGLYVNASDTLATAFWIFIALRWLSGLLGTLMMARLTWQTLKIPNTQSATGILYAGVILAFIGELTSQLLSVGSLYPL